jgi:hypothetical protein
MSGAEKAEFIIVQRCATYGFWPERSVESEKHQIDSPGEQTLTTVSICATHYGNVTDHREPLRRIETPTEFDFGLAFHKGFLEGSEYYVGDQGLRTSLERRFPFEGELDIFFKVTSSSGEPPPDKIRNNLISLSS